MLSSCPWKEYKTDSGRIYYHNFQTNETRWNKPIELEELELAIQKQQIQNDFDQNSDFELKKNKELNHKTIYEQTSEIDQAIKATLADIELPNETKIKEDTRFFNKPNKFQNFA